jgi:hypothetical protein
MVLGCWRGMTRAPVVAHSLWGILTACLPHVWVGYATAGDCAEVLVALTAAASAQHSCSLEVNGMLGLLVPLP